MKRSEKVAFMGVKNGSSTTFQRMKGFTELSVSKNPKEYSRKYIDEDSERSSVVGYSPSMSYKYDEDAADAVHKTLADIADNELTEDAAKVTIVIVNLAKPTTQGGSSFEAVQRDYCVIPDGEGDDEDTYTRNGEFKAAGNKIIGSATTSDEWQTATFTAQDTE